MKEEKEWRFIHSSSFPWRKIFNASNPDQPAGGIAMRRQILASQPVSQAKVEIGDRCLLGADVAAGRERAAAGARQEERQVGVPVLVAVGDAAAVEHHRVMQERLA